MRKNVKMTNPMKVITGPNTRGAMPTSGNLNPSTVALRNIVSA